MPQTTDTFQALASGSPLAALHAQSALIRVPRATASDEAVLQLLLRSDDRLARVLAVRPLSRIAGSDFDAALHVLARSDDLLMREQAVWALGDRPATAAGIAAVVGAVAGGGHAAVIGQLAVERWADAFPAVASAIAAELEHWDDEATRARLVETTSIGGDPEAQLLLTRVLRSTEEHDAVRAAAARGLAALATPNLLDDLRRAALGGGPELRFACTRALLSLRTAVAGEAAARIASTVLGSDEPYDRLLVALVRGRAIPPPERRGLRIAQVFVQGRLDGELTYAGAGDGGGIATLLVHLGRALGSEPAIDRVATIARALAEPETGWRHTALSEAQGPSASIERIPFGPAGYVPASDLWQHRLELERALETAISELGGVDIAHLRFADAGAFAAARVCRRLGIPVVFTAAPDPHGVIAAAERTGELTRETFPTTEQRQHYLQRAQLVETLLDQAAAVVVLPRPDARVALGRLIGKPFTQLDDGRIQTIAEGISLAEVDRAGSDLERATRDGQLPSVAADLLDEIATLPPKRHGLPLLVSVGRLHRVKGLPLLLEAWAGDDDLLRSLNLVLVGGNLEQPTSEEEAVLGQIDEVCARLPQARKGLALLGHRPNHDVATVLRIAQAGLTELIEPHGIYACASQKEEFGVALLEAMATGLAVIAPNSGGPATYVEEGTTGFLADTTSIESVRAALHRALASRNDEPRARRTSNIVRSTYTIEAMAESLASVYADVGRESDQVAA